MFTQIRRALFRRPTRFEIVVNAIWWVTLATGHATSAPKGFYLEAQTDTSGWVVVEGGSR